MLRIKHDCEAEDALARDLEGMNKIAKDVMKSCPKKIDEKLTDEFIHERYQMWNNKFNTDLPPPPKEEIMQWLCKNPAVRTNDLELLIQRYYFKQMNYADVSYKARPYCSHLLEDAINREIHARRPPQPPRMMYRDRRAVVMPSIPQLPYQEEAPPDKEFVP